MLNLYKSTEYCTGINWGGYRSTYCLLEDIDAIPSNFELVKADLTQGQIAFLREIGLIASEEFRLKLQRFGQAIANLRHD